MASFTILCIVFCSLRVGYGSISSHSFTKDMYKRFTNVTYVLSTPSRIACCLACAEKPGCEAVSYSSRFQTCELAGTGSATESHLSWNLYKKTGGSGCQLGWDMIGNACFLYDDIARTRPYAQGNCTSRWPHSTLVDFKTSVKESAVMNWLLSVTSSNSGANTLDQGVWLGGRWNPNADTYTWTDGQSLSAGFQNWAIGEPSNPNIELCIGALVQNDLQWCDVSCESFLLHAVCEYTLV